KLCCMKMPIIILLLIFLSRGFVYSQIPYSQNVSLCGNYNFENDIKRGHLRLGNGDVTWLPDDKFIYNGKDMGNYALKWENDTWQTNCKTLWLSGYGGIKLFTSAISTPRVAITKNGDVELSGNQYLSLGKTITIGSKTNSNSRMQFVFDGYSSIVNHAGYLHFIDSKKTNVGVLFGRGTDYSEILLGSRTDRLQRLRLAYYENANGSGGETYINNHGGSIYISVKRNDGFDGSPIAKFDGNGLEVKGRIRTSVGSWSDFVFSEEYKLPSLSEIKSHIKEHKHLPNIPSELEVKENGIDLTEMQAKLLQKIEELTLNPIQQQEMIDELKKEVDSLKTNK
ncbi:MAG: hypothetical protein LIO93_04800, partial [Bacteroidales bacterium]|nr:hypothetical protein [Bacteroidales bacterium]